MAFVNNGQQLLATRFLLVSDLNFDQLLTNSTFSLKGMAQSGFFTGTIIYFSLWYCKREQILRFSILFGAVFAAGVLDGIIVSIY